MGSEYCWFETRLGRCDFYVFITYIISAVEDWTSSRKRACIGEPFTMMQVFLFLTSIVKNFELVLPDGAKASTSEELMAGKLLVVARPRSQK
ncbi:hypothetical protein AVEN_65812-1 [Araneus ventricosus]|uniref:Uncharacterized protein n=1 Tax=Araneus ventricosus TaxID=182803 RepID=A0A4Y2W3N3_ARAVE|nr:hypothetical protein AVEN_223283-1 [Araneus ventricosus]GBO30740.1 hypothetical protein AVEN_65812-1 [Araneus ventricosus]